MEKVKYKARRDSQCFHIMCTIKPTKIEELIYLLCEFIANRLIDQRMTLVLCNSNVLDIIYSIRVFCLINYRVVSGSN